MKITFLGTSNATPKRGKNCSATMLEVGESIYFIDGGAPLIEEFLKIKSEDELTRVRAIFTTHSHGDHTYGIMHMAGLMDWYYKLPIEVYLTTEDMIDAFVALYRATDGGIAKFHPNRVKLKLEDPNVGYEDENIKLYFIPNTHMKKSGAPSYSILVEAQGKRVLFSGDLPSRPFDNTVLGNLCREHIDLFICELSHFTVEELTPMLQETGAEKIYFNHIGKLINTDEILSKKEQLNLDICFPEDGDFVEI